MEEIFMKVVYRLTLLLHIFVGVGAMAGGTSGILEPQGPMGISVDILKNSPFTNFFIPCLILFVVIGLGNILSAVVVYKKPWYYGYVSSVSGWALVIWIIVQCIMLNAIEPLHIIFFLIGLIQAILAVIELFNKRLFPTNIVISLYEKLMRKKHV
jgi:hypothetical protein